MADFEYCEDIPVREDLYEGQPQERLAESLCSYIRSEDAKDVKIIGLEGARETGKSNAIKILEKKIGEEYDVFIYNVWGHQEEDHKYYRSAIVYRNE